MDNLNMTRHKDKKDYRASALRGRSKMKRTLGREDMKLDSPLVLKNDSIAKPLGRNILINTNRCSEKIINALNNTKYTARTLDGIAKEVGEDKRQIVKIIKNDPSLRAKVKMYRRKSSDGRFLITTKDRFIDFFSTLKVSIEDVQ